MTKKNYDNCEHKWEFSIDAASSGIPVRKSETAVIPENKPWMSFYVCNKCQHSINFLEKSSLDQIAAQNESLEIQQKHTRNGMWANIISAIVMITAVTTLLINQFCGG